MVAGWDRQRDGATGRLLIHLAKAISRHRPLNLTVNAARRRTPLGEALTINDLPCSTSTIPRRFGDLSW